MPSSFSGVENRISEARERHQDLHQAAHITTTVNALNEANEALDTKANAALALSLLAATISIIALKRR